MTATCVTCRFFKIAEAGDEGTCFRYPPLVAVVHEEVYATGTDERGIAWEKRTFWPDTSPDDWCGEWHPKVGFAYNGVALRNADTP